ncbi:MAG TPA: hypothetical protein VMF65_17610 [Acidimicrobiales bacterium]|nr:hypothetical protein [Acidimicrobiales bacterium]
MKPAPVTSMMPTWRHLERKRPMATVDQRSQYCLPVRGAKRVDLAAYRQDGSALHEN